MTQKENPDNPAFRDEFFGPVVAFYRVENEDEAVTLANDSDFGLGGSVFTRDIARGERIASRIDTEMMFINNIDWTDADLPFGGIKDSGYGRELGNMGIQQFVNWKLVRTNDIDAPQVTSASGAARTDNPEPQHRDGRCHHYDTHPPIEDRHRRTRKMLMGHAV
jgi:hypothetical protein